MYNIYIYIYIYILFETDVPEMSLYNQMQRNPNCKQIQIPDMGKG